MATAASNRQGDTFRLSRAESQAQHKNRKEDEHLQVTLHKLNITQLRQQVHFKERWREYQATTRLITASSGYLKDHDVTTADKYARYQTSADDDQKHVRWQTPTPTKKRKFRRLCASAPVIKVHTQPRSSRMLRHETRKSTEINLRIAEPHAFTKLWSARAPTAYNSRVVSRMQSASAVSKTLNLTNHRSVSAATYNSSCIADWNREKPDLIPERATMHSSTFLTQSIPHS